MQGIYNYKPETNDVSRTYSVAAVFKFCATCDGISPAKYVLYLYITGARCWWRSWLRHCATSQKVAGSIPDGVSGIFH
jgi:hypothetical protein